MKPEPRKLRDSTQEQELLRVVALWAAGYAEEALSVFESRHSDDTRPREAVAAGREFGQGKKRDKNLRMLALAAMKAGKDVDDPSKYAARAATLTASVAYMHTDLQTGLQGIRQARHVLGPVVYAALALEVDAGNDHGIGNAMLQRAINDAPSEARYILESMPPQPKKDSRLDVLFFELDSALRG
ncbi:MAG TPA: hypothetical protein VI322_03185 [Candidatus Saccharimonadia bacterium]